MKLDIIDIEKKNKIVDEAILRLKNDFVGIDEQIDEIMNNVRTWYLYPQLQDRPLIVSIFGLTGTGKTALIKKIAKYLDIEKDLVYFNFAEINEMHSYEIEDTIEEELSNENSSRMFVYDEFQYAATLDEDGCEKDNKSGLKPFWELMDSGILHKRNSIWDNRFLFNTISYLTKINIHHPVMIEDGQWVNAKECLKDFKNYEIMQFKEYFNFEIDDVLSEKEIRSVQTLGSGKRMVPKEDTCEFFIKEHVLEQIFRLFRKSNSVRTDNFDLYNELYNKSYDEIIDLFIQTYDNISKGYDLKFNSSIIFVIANLDEAYEISFNVNPDMSPDQFHKITKKINIVDIKEALKKRFRNEQIARLGNIHVIYPSFSSETFKKIIDMTLNNYATTVNELIGYKLVFDNSIKKCIFDEAVFPTQGTRPVFSTIHEIVKSKLPEIVRKINENGYNDKIDYIKFSFKNKKTIINCYYNNEVVVKILFKDKLRLKNLRESTQNEQQTLCAVHESGHFVVYTALMDRIPEKLVSKTTDTKSNGFLLKDEEYITNVNSFNKIINEIKISLGGYIAEKIVFGEKYITNGACADLEHATVLASKAIREWGFGSHPYLTTYVSTPHPKGSISCYAIKDSNNDVNTEITNFFNKIYAETEELLNKKEWKSMLKESSVYLSQHSSMPKKKMKEIYNNVPNEVKVCQNGSYYRDKLKEFK